MSNYPASLHNHTDFSNLRLRDCINRVEDIIDYAIELGHKAIAITDHETVSNAIKVEKYYKKVKEKHPDFKVIRGNEIYLCRNGLNADNFRKGEDKYYHFILLAKDLQGNEQIREISTRAWTRSYMARGMRRVPTYYQDLVDIISPNKGHVIGSSACLGGALPTQILKARDTHSPQLYEKVKLWIRQMVNIFGEGNFYLELQPEPNADQTYVNHKLVELSEELKVPYIITTDSHYLKKEDRPIHKAFLNAQEGDREVDSFYALTYMMSTEELKKHLTITEEQIETAFNNIQEIIDKCEDYSLLKPLKIPQLPWKHHYHTSALSDWFDKIPMLKQFSESEHVSNRELAEAIVSGLERHLDCQNEAAYNEINNCLNMTWVSSEKNKASWASYFLNLQKIIDECWEAGSIVGCGRGSGVGFLLLYLLDITQINPLRETTKTFAWRFLNPDRVSVLDVDVDIEGGRREQVLNHLRQTYGQDRVANVATFGTEKSKSAILTAARGLGIDNDIASYISSLVPAERGLVWTLDQCMYGDEENDLKPVKQFVFEMTKNYPELWEVAHKIEGLINRVGIHAGGVIFVDEPFTKSTALMRAPDGTVITQLDLHDAEDVSLIKYDLLSVEAMDRIHTCLDLICDAGYAERKPTLKETYESIIGIYNLKRTDKKMWEMVWNHQIQALFQMEKASGVNGIELTKPESVDDLATLNSVIRLMALEKGAEQPLNKYARFKSNIQYWYREMDQYGLTPEEQKLLEPIVKISYGICESQERFMQLVQMPECGGFDLTWADKLRKSIAKKNPKEYYKLQDEYFATVKEKELSKNLCNYVWNVLIATSRGYGFNLSHTLAYSLIALQEMNLAYNYPIIFWNCACLITDSGGNESLSEESEDKDEPAAEVVYDNAVEEFTSEDEDDDDDEEESKSAKGKKKQTKTVNYGRIAAAIGKMTMAGITISPPDINKSAYTFSPDADENIIRYGISGITRIGEDAIKEIIAKRPYESLSDFTNKVKLNKPQMINLIKSGAFDGLGDRRKIMEEYIRSVSDQKKRITLQNMKMLIDFKLLPPEYDFECKVYNYNKYLKKFKDGVYYLIDNIAFKFYEDNFDIDKIEPHENGFRIKQTVWDTIYQNNMNKVRPYIQSHNKELLEAVNNKLIADLWDKYCQGSLSKWEMDSVSYYSHIHELVGVNLKPFGVEDFYKLNEEPDIDYVFPKDGKQIPIFKIHRIAGTVIEKDKSKKTVTLLTTTGVVVVKLFGPMFANYDKQISEKGPDGKKHVIEKSIFSRGNKIIVTGIRRGNDFIAKKYSRTPYHLIEWISEIKDDNSVVLCSERADV